MGFHMVLLLKCGLILLLHKGIEIDLVGRVGPTSTTDRFYDFFVEESEIVVLVSKLN